MSLGAKRFYSFGPCKVDCNGVSSSAKTAWNCAAMSTSDAAILRRRRRRRRRLLFNDWHDKTQALKDLKIIHYLVLP